MPEIPPTPKLTLVSVEEVSNAAREAPREDGRPEEGRPLPASGPHRAPSDAEQTAPGKTDAGRPRRASDMEMLRPVTPRGFGRYELLLEMGRGGMATLYLARIRGPEHFEKLLAVKRIHDHLTDDPDFVNMFLDEARIAARIHHPNVASLFEMGEVDGQHYLALEYVHGQTLTDILKRSVGRPGPFPWPLATRIIADAAAGLHAAHQIADGDGRPLGVVHRDVSPHNLLVSYDGHVKLIDFGIAFAARKLTQTGVGILKGKTGYMSPEQVDGKPLDARSDIFALGIVLYESLTRSRLFHAETDTASLLKVREAYVPPPRSRVPAIPEALEAIVMKALARRPEDRYATAEELGEACNELLVKQGEMVGRKRVAGMMSEYFRERMLVKDQQIRIAKQRRDPTLVSDPLLSAAPELPCTRPVERIRLGTRWFLWVSVAAAVATALALTWILVGQGGAAPGAHSSTAAPKERAEGPRSPRAGVAPMGATPARETAPVSPTPARITVTVTVRSPRRGVTMRLGEHWYPGRTGRFSLPRGTGPVSILVRARGHRDRRLTLVPDRNRTVEVSLKPRGRLRHRPRRAMGKDRNGLLRFDALGKSRRRRARRPRSKLLNLPD